MVKCFSYKCQLNTHSKNVMAPIHYFWHKLIISGENLLFLGRLIIFGIDFIFMAAAYCLWHQLVIYAANLLFKAQTFMAQIYYLWYKLITYITIFYDTISLFIVQICYLTLII